MRLSLSFLVLPSLAAFAAAYSAPDPVPGASFHQVNARDLRVRAKYPEYFKRSTPSGIICGATRKRSLPADATDVPPEQVLHPPEMAAFLIGGGKFVSENGTSYFDEHFMRKHAKDVAKFKAGAPKTWHDSLRDKVSAAILDISLPAYKMWRNQWKDPDAILYLAPSTVIRAKDLEALELALLEDPTFEEIYIEGYRVTRRWMEAAVEFIA
ncbi:uncharacterized protein EV420DRAFT_497213 [Desarmillaria tabescens]|uniref:EthD domain-containing protein n=1 Tax=Armillaria tabescens TaxID=1929756 RepID=A0AA39N445_ARMTA|nr:uncharacterized protein EV420DRAFT_497213 [Desarmillaria tabescens]KAK0457486.1 hypothetical protein EV420DRAFT_497213 [Desarmillaria tabescens]